MNGTVKFGGLIVRSKAGKQYARFAMCSREVKVARAGSNGIDIEVS